MRRVLRDFAMVAAFMAALPIAFLLCMAFILNDLSIVWTVIPNPALAIMVIVILIGIAAAWEREKKNQ